MRKAPRDIHEDAKRNGHNPHKTFTARELMAMELPEIVWAIPDILPAGVTLLGGKPKMGKSWLCLGIGIAIATGGVALGTKRVEAGDCLYLALEDNHRRLQKRLRKLLDGAEAPEKLHLEVEWDRTDEGGLQALDAWLAEHPACRLVIADTHARLKPQAAKLGNRTRYDEDRASVDPLAPLAARHNVAILLVHHLRETESDDPLDMIHDTAGLTGGVDNALVLKRRRGNADAYLTVDGRDIVEPVELALRWEHDVASWVIQGDADEHRRSQTRRDILRVVGEAPEPVGPAYVAGVLDLPTNTVQQRMYQMSGDGDLRNVSRGLYTLHNNNNDRNDDKNHKDHKDASLTDLMVLMGVLKSKNASGETMRERCYQAVVDELGIAGRGPARALENYLASPSDERLEYVGRAVLVARGVEQASLEALPQEYLSVVQRAAHDPANHQDGCGCELCS